MSLVVILVLGVACVAVAVFGVKAWERRRARMLKEAGAALGLRAYEKGEQLIVPSVEIMRKRRRTIGVVLEGEWKGSRIKIFDLSYPTSNAVARTTIFMLRLGSRRIPEFAAIRKSLLLYRPTVDLPRVESPPPGPARRHLLYAPNAEWPLGEDAAKFLQRTPGWSFEGRGSGIFLYRRGKRAPAQSLEAWIDEAYDLSMEIAKRIPAPAPDVALEAEGEFGRKLTFSSKISFRV
ncbi:MAG TPA: hypothetical protein VFV10_17510 [Gammaproteobacteria bacterium]|nr:hypothetical protein [Gammaproteobacteria bacterium]